MKYTSSPIRELYVKMNELEKFIVSLNQKETQYSFDSEIKLSDEATDELKSRHGDIYFDKLLVAIKSADIQKSNQYLKRLKKAIRFVKNDSPAEKGQRVSVIRYEHGWINGNWSGTVQEIYGKLGCRYSYTVAVDEKDGDTCEPFEVYISHSRDISY